MRRKDIELKQNKTNMHIESSIESYFGTFIDHIVDFNTTANVKTVDCFGCHSMFEKYKLQIVNEKSQSIHFGPIAIGWNVLVWEYAYELLHIYLICNLNSAPGENTILSVRNSVCHSEFSIVLSTISFSLNRGFKWHAT